MVQAMYLRHTLICCWQAVLVGERLTGRGVVQALGHPTGIPLAEMDVALGLLAGALLVGGLVPTNIVYERCERRMRLASSDMLVYKHIAPS